MNLDLLTLKHTKSVESICLSKNWSAKRESTCEDATVRRIDYAEEIG